jgi:hypothetical protein
MFKCDVLGKFSQPGEKCLKLVIETRPRTYVQRVRNEETLRWEDLVVGSGTEIVRELNVTESGLKFWDTLSDEGKAKHLALTLTQRYHAAQI